MRSLEGVRVADSGTSHVEQIPWKVAGNDAFPFNIQQTVRVPIGISCRKVSRVTSRNDRKRSTLHANTDRHIPPTYLLIVLWNFLLDIKRSASFFVYRSSYDRTVNENSPNRSFDKGIRRILDEIRRSSRKGERIFLGNSSRGFRRLNAR